MDETPSIPNMGHGKQIAVGPLGIHPANPSDMPKTIIVSRADLRMIFEECTADKGMLPPPPRQVEVRSMKEPYVPEFLLCIRV
ncbi:UNVERIFIED_CONTAM: hypothetical protein Slati_1520600 [Sesamum latifolium]|uniref:Uncharacterized protein n=1 Tax=Sesamum latifolium TaxID=2727402 RepID=A0AAW2XA19_9LAMI